MGASDIRFVKVMGERNSGTNVAEAVVRTNLTLSLCPNAPDRPTDIGLGLPSSITGVKYRQAVKQALADDGHLESLPLCGGWKHAAASEALARFARDKAVFVLFILRNPATWIRSQHRNPFHAGMAVPRDFGAFLRSPWITARRDELARAVLPSPADLIALKFPTYDRFAREVPMSAVIRYEDLILAPEETLGALPIWDHRKSDRITLPRQSARQRGRGNRDLAAYRAKILNEGLDGLAPDDRRYLCARLRGSGLERLYPEIADSA